MESSIITNTLLPIALGVIMLGLGLSLSIDDFTRVVRFPKAVLVGLFIQMFVLTAACFGIAVLLQLPPELAVGMMLLAASPGGATANIYSHLAHGDVALNITLTAINSLLSLFALPFIVSGALVYFMGADQYVPPPFKKVIEVGVIILGPVAIGMFLRSRFVSLALRLERPIRIFSVLLLASLVVAAVAQEWAVLTRYFAVVGVACLLFNLLSMGVGYGIPLAVKLPDRQAIAIAMEIGIHNGTLAIFIALNVLGNGTMSVPAAIYSLFMFVTAGVFAWWLNRRHRPSAANGT
ncbi:MAG: bile acid:sodium symporter family protein [Betaproteobacteria bacterium]|nr:bile acid:sodium symporter family protein [Betaproteobacteria bacterium]